jgi:hypothetical protein
MEPISESRCLSDPIKKQATEQTSGEMRGSSRFQNMPFDLRRRPSETAQVSSAMLEDPISISEAFSLGAEAQPPIRRLVVDLNLALQPLRSESWPVFDAACQPRQCTFKRVYSVYDWYE